MATVAVLTPYRDSDARRRENFNWTQNRWRTMLGGTAQLLVGASPPGPFNRSYAINAARKNASTDTEIIIVADADTHGDLGTIQAAIRACSQKRAAPCILPYTRYYNLTDTCSQKILNTPAERDIKEDFEFEHLITSPPVVPYGDPISGILVMPALAFDVLGGFDEDYVGWGYEDKDFIHRMNEMWGPQERIDGFVFHLWHPVEVDPFTTDEAKKNEARYHALKNSGL